MRAPDGPVDMPTDTVPAAAPGPPGGSSPGGPHRLVQNILVGVALYACIAHLDGTWPPASAEPAALRWLRKLAEHPLRVSLGLGLVLGALRPARRSGPWPRLPGGPIPGAWNPPRSPLRLPRSRGQEGLPPRPASGDSRGTRRLPSR